MTKLTDDRKAENMIGGDNEMMGLKNHCVPLIFDCPRNAISPKCPFAEIRTRDVVDRVNWVKAKTMQQLRSILKHHSDCIERGAETTTEKKAR